MIKPQPEDKVEEMILKVNAFIKKLEDYKNLGISKVVIEEPLLGSNNIHNVGVLMRYNAMITKAIYDALGVVPNYISTYNSRKFAWPKLMGKNDKNRETLFGAYPKDIDKKQVIWEFVSKQEPQIVWLYTKNMTLKKECFDQSDAYTCVRGYMKMNSFW